MNEDWKQRRKEQDEFLQNLQMDFTWVEWEKDAAEISYVPKGWQKIVCDLFASMNDYCKMKRGKFEDTLICKFKFTTNRKITNIRRFICKFTDPYKPFKPKHTDWYFFTPQEQEKIRQTRRYKITNKINKLFLRCKFNMNKHYIEYYAPIVRIEQIKEKFGYLVIYVSGGDKQIDGMIFMAENLAKRTCEITGNHGEMCLKKGWYKTLSKEKAKEMGFTPVKDLKSPESYT